MKYFILCVLIILSLTSSFKLKKFPISQKSVHENSVKEQFSALIKATASSLVMMPLTASAAVDSTPVVVPLVISVLTIVPFVLYQQALKPKPRTIKQIELDENLRPKDKKLQSGKIGQAVAEKRKK